MYKPTTNGYRKEPILNAQTNADAKRAVGSKCIFKNAR